GRMSNYSFKRGSSLAFNVQYTPAENGPPSLAGIVIKSQIRTPAGALVSELNVAMFEDEMGFTATASSTAAWPLGQLNWDIRFEQSGSVFYSETLSLTVRQEVTA